MAQDQGTQNPYEDAEPIPVPPRSSRPRRQANNTSSSHTRSRSVQSARDGAPQTQQRIRRVSGSQAQVRSARPAGSRTTGARDSQRRTSRPASSSQRGRQQPSARKGQRATGYTPYATAGGGRRAPQGGQPYGMRTRRKMGFGIIAAIIIVAIAVLGGILYWINRPVPVTINGEAAEVRVGSSLADVLHEQRISVTPGDYVSVTDAVLAAGEGRAFTATVNGDTLDAADTDAYRIEGNEAIEFSDGANVCEDYEAETEQIMPYLRFSGSGYALQYVSQWGYAGEREYRTGKESGESAWVTTKEAQDCVITCIDPYIEGDTKYVALTFDDGPADPYTEQYLEILDRYGVKATFFNLGVNIQQYPDLARAIVDHGHQLCNHTMDHNQLTAVDADTIYNEITRSADVIEQTTGQRVTHIRPPYGDFTQDSWLASRGAVTASIRWTGDSQDWALPGVDALASNALLNHYSGSIILMHDGGGDRSQDVGALPQIIEQLQAEGYQFVTIADLMRAMGDIPEDVCSGTATMPEDAVWPDEISDEPVEEQATDEGAADTAEA